MKPHRSAKTSGRSLSARLIQTVLLVICTALPCVAAPPAPKATTLDELARRYDISSCRECHSTIYAEWEQSIHARSLIGTMNTMFSLKTAITEGMFKEWKHSGVTSVADITAEHMLACLKCHLPQLREATDDVAREIARAVLASDQETLAKVSINCLVCHNSKALVHQWVDGKPEAGTVYGAKDGNHPDKRFPQMKKSPIMSEAIICGQCHGLGPNFDLPNPTQCATLYGSYLHAYIPAGGTKTCQDCHMRKKGTGHLMPSYRNPQETREAVRVDVETRAFYGPPVNNGGTPTSVVSVTLTSAAGHRIPDG